MKVYLRGQFWDLFSSLFVIKPLVIMLKMVHLYADETIMYANAPTVDLSVSKLQSDSIAMQESLGNLNLCSNDRKVDAVRDPLKQHHAIKSLSLPGPKAKVPRWVSIIYKDYLKAANENLDNLVPSC
jgi:hypothetical protein